jgi:hypothetical protein
MIRGLVVLNSSYVGSRDLWWPNDPLATVGYNVYRAFDYPANWVKLNTSPVEGQFYRDISTLTQITYTVQATDWVEKGTFGRWGFKIPDVPYSGIVETRPQVASSPDDVSLLLTLNYVANTGGLTGGLIHITSALTPIAGSISIKVGSASPTAFSVPAYPNNTLAGLAGVINAAAIGVTATVTAVNPVGGGISLELSSSSVLTVVSSVTVSFRPAMVSGIDQTIWINTDTTLPLGGAVSNFPVCDPWKITTFQAVYNQLSNFVDIYSFMVRTYYSVVSVSGTPQAPEELEPAGSPGSDIVNTHTIERVNYMLKEQIRRNAWVFERVGEPAFIMFRKSRGTRCGCTMDGVEEPRHNCPSCFETGWVGGYYGPYDIVYIPPDTAITTTIEEGGRKVERRSKSYLGPTPIVQNGDLIVRRNGDRLIVSNPLYKQPQGAIVQQEFDVELLNQKDTRYLIPVIAGNPNPSLFNPVFQKDPTNGVGGTEPLFEKENVVDAQWENPNPEVGRTTTWGAIQT